MWQSKTKASDEVFLIRENYLNSQLFRTFLCIQQFSSLSVGKQAKNFSKVLAHAGVIVHDSNVRKRHCDRVLEKQSDLKKKLLPIPMLWWKNDTYLFYWTKNMWAGLSKIGGIPRWEPFFGTALFLVELWKIDINGQAGFGTMPCVEILNEWFQGQKDISYFEWPKN